MLPKFAILIGYVKPQLRKIEFFTTEFEYLNVKIAFPPAEKKMSIKVEFSMVSRPNWTKMI